MECNWKNSSHIWQHKTSQTTFKIRSINLTILREGTKKKRIWKAGKKTTLECRG